MPTALLGIAEIADLAKVSKQAVSNWRTRYDRFPRPIQILQSGPVWEKEKVEAWIKSFLRSRSIEEERALAEEAARYLSRLGKRGVAYNGSGIGKTYWDLGLFLETGKHSVSSSSGPNFHKWHRKSDSAAARLRELPLADWTKEVTWEHCRSLQNMSKLVREEQATPQRLLEIVGEYPPVVILKTENPKREFDDLPPVERYRAAGITYANFGDLKSDRWKEQAKHLFVTEV